MSTHLWMHGHQPRFEGPADDRHSIHYGSMAREAVHMSARTAFNGAREASGCEHDVVRGSIFLKVVGVGGEGEAEKAGVVDAFSHPCIFKRISQEQQVPAARQPGGRRRRPDVFIQAVDQRGLVRHRNAAGVENQRVGDNVQIVRGYAFFGESGFDDFPDAGGQNDQGNASLAEGMKKTARTFSQVRPIFANDMADRPRTELVIQQQIELEGPPAAQVTRLDAFRQFGIAFDPSVAIKQFPVTPGKRRTEMSTVGDNRTGGLIASIFRGGPGQRSVPVADNKEPVRPVGLKLLQLVTPSHAVIRRSGKVVYWDDLVSRDWDSTFLRIFPGLNITFRRAGT